MQRPCPGGEHQARHAGLRRAEPMGCLEWPQDTGRIKSHVRLPESPPQPYLKCGLSTALHGVLSKGSPLLGLVLDSQED